MPRTTLFRLINEQESLTLLDDLVPRGTTMLYTFEQFPGRVEEIARSLHVQTSHLAKATSAVCAAVQASTVPIGSQ